MSYVIEFGRRRAGNGPSGSLTLCHNDREAWRSFVEGATRLAGPAESTSLVDRLEMSWDEPRVRLEYTGSSAAIRVPFWYVGPPAAVVIHRAYGIGRLLADSTGLRACDPQTGGDLDEDNHAAGLAAYLAASRLAGGINDRLGAGRRG